MVFDIGGVLLDWNPRHLYRKLVGDPAEMERFLTQVCTPGWHRAHDLGADVEQSCKALAAAHPAEAELIMAWAYRGEEMVAGQIDQSVRVLEEVSGLGLACYALSNMEADRFAYRRCRYPFFGLFDGCVISGLERVAKPDREIFDILLARHGLDPAATVFVDDTPGNVAAARALGIVAVEFAGAGQLRRELRALGVGVGPG